MIKRYSNFLNENFEFVESVSMIQINNKWGSLDQTLYYARKKIINKYVKFFNLDDRKEVKTVLKDIYYKRFVKEDGESLGNSWYVIDNNDKEYWLRVNTEIEIYKLTNKELDPYGEDDWI